MLPFIVLLTVFLVLLGLRAAGVPALRARSWVFCLRLALASMFLLTASAHWGNRRLDLVQMVPPGFPNPELLVTISGLAEIAGAIGLLIPRLAPYAAGGLSLLLLAVFPANVHAARAALTIGGEAVTPLILRAPLQIVFMLAVLVAGFWPLRTRKQQVATNRTHSAKAAEQDA